MALFSWELAEAMEQSVRNSPNYEYTDDDFEVCAEDYVIKNMSKFMPKFAHKKAELKKQRKYRSKSTTERIKWLRAFKEI